MRHMEPREEHREVDVRKGTKKVWEDVPGSGGVRGWGGKAESKGNE